MYTIIPIFSIDVDDIFEIYISINSLCVKTYD